jgi:hypothetical protein
MENSRILLMAGVATAFLCGCQSTPVQELPFADPEVKSELREQEEWRIHEDYQRELAMARQREEVQRNLQRQRAQQRQNGN